jgi:6-phosphofructokinase 1
MTLTVGVLTSGGDAPGMNAAIRSVVRMGAHRGFKLLGFHRGYEGLIRGDFEALQPRSVSNILQRGGTILKTARSEDFETENGRARAREVLDECGVNALVVIGGDGSFRGGHLLGEGWDGQVVGVPATIDNDIYGTDDTIGFDTALNTALDAIDRIRDTASAHERVFLIEVMGRHSGFIALDVGTAGGAEEIFVPEVDTDLDACAERLMGARKKGKSMSILICAEGDDQGGAFAVAETIQRKTGFEPRVTVLGHIQRGGRPSARDRILATKLGAFAIEEIQNGKTDVMVGETRGELATTPLEQSWTRKKELDAFLVELIPILAR